MVRVPDGIRNRALGSPLNRALGCPFLVDGLLAAACAALLFPGFLGKGAPVWLAALLAVFSAGPLAVRRSKPLAVLATTTAVFLAALLWMGEPGPGMVSCLVALYSAAVAAPRTRALVTGTVTVVVVPVVTLLVTGRRLLDPGNLVLIALLGATTAVGDATRNRRAYIQAIKDRALRAERTREVEARRRVAEERLRLARDLHDIVAHSITVINFQAGAAVQLLRREPDAAEAAIEHVIAASGSTLAELGTMLTVLRQPDGEPLPPEPMPALDRLDDLLDGFRAAGLAIDLRRGGKAFGLSPAVSMAGYRIVQESLTNALKYATPRTARVRLSFAAHRLRITVVNPVARDEARPGPAAVSPLPSPERWGTGRGLLGLRERAASVGGRLDVLEGHGEFSVDAFLPAPRTKP
ncbi:sensor histidine kinase [Streptomyces sp. NPDC001797]|uniref:histidine kinase n=1 Tax=Streptomyces sp. 900105755 TaxID=3154389 RepID=A0ABV1TKV3_9ACTN